MGLEEEPRGRANATRGEEEDMGVRYGYVQKGDDNRDWVGRMKNATVQKRDVVKAIAESVIKSSSVCRDFLWHVHIKHNQLIS